MPTGLLLPYGLSIYTRASSKAGRVSTFVRRMSAGRRDQGALAGGRLCPLGCRAVALPQGCRVRPRRQLHFAAARPHLVSAAQLQLDHPQLGRRGSLRRPYPGQQGG